MWSGFQAKKLNTNWELEFELVANWAETENQAGLVTALDPDQKKNCEFFSKNQIRNYACSARERTACCVNICPRKVGCQNCNGPPDTLYHGWKWMSSKNHVRNKRQIQTDKNKIDRSPHCPPTKLYFQNSLCYSPPNSNCLCCHLCQSSSHRSPAHDRHKLLTNVLQ